MKISIRILYVLLFTCASIYAQKDTIKLKEVSISSNRITLPFSKTSRTITILTADDILKNPASNLADLLQNVSGIDIRRRGTDGMQSDLYIRGGNFDQSLVLIDGVKMDDVQTGHHNMNAIISLENIERIEIIKGPAARIYGQNAFSGAINIVTKNVVENALNTQLNYGSYSNIKGVVSLSQKFNEGGILASVNYQESDGYRYNTDFENISTFLKSNFKNYNLTTSFTQRKFGANGFYASPSNIDQYEETQTSLVALGTEYGSDKILVKPRMYWRRNQDMYLFIRNNPSYYRNMHISNKVGMETNVVFNSKLGKTGVGLDLARVFLVSTNLGNHNRTVLTGFLEHRFELLNEKLDITPGLAISHYSDFDSKAFPGLDVGYRISDEFKLYGNIGYTYRVPTFTDLFYVGPTTLGNPDLQPESALSEEIGFKYNTGKFKLDIALFNRKSDDLIDWTKENEADKWQTRNFSEVVSQGIETEINYIFNLVNYNQSLKIGYSFIEDDIRDNNVQYTRYSLNSIKHQFTAGFDSKFNSIFGQNISYRYVERTDGISYNVLDVKFLAVINSSLQLSLAANNIFNANYTETNLIPMPKGNLMFGLNYKVY
ncbi:iron complex outermembrane receptor protein [Lutibacter oceani]|uniref:Iron complex outermembrane receptor protein n=1 Tax=Lutibacter oceani TaxID=1853311 RepID=A0A3D9RYA4_9FLAO|nr:TonB-dependent receptor [Lutibacter oceani]REE82811.1 iron complex outermembrane receptor protein [Lutibacter oceani]